MRPVILIITEDGFDVHLERENFVLSHAYSSAIQRAGGIPVTALDVRAAEEYAAIADGLLLTGGPVIHPARYGGIGEHLEELIAFSRTRDDLDFMLGQLFLWAGKPILGIGRGAMVANVLLGGTVEKHLPTLPSVSTDRVCGAARALLGETISFSRQYAWGIGRLGEDLEVPAVSPEGSVDGVFHRTRPVWGVTWHPERELNGIPADDRLFELLVREAAK